MLIVAMDTSGRKGSVALCRGDAPEFETLQTDLARRGNYSAQLDARDLRRSSTISTSIKVKWMASWWSPAPAHSPGCVWDWRP